MPRKGQLIRYGGWFGLSALTFGLATLLTFEIASVEGHLPFGSREERQPKVQAFGIFLDEGAKIIQSDLPVRVSYSETRKCPRLSPNFGADDGPPRRETTVPIHQAHLC